MEPWDGPASIAFTDGTRDRRGARSQRAASVALLRHQGRPRHHGVRGRRARHPARGRAGQGASAPGHASSSSTPSKGRIVDDEEIKRELAAEHPYRRVARRRTWSTSTTCRPARAEQPDHETVFKRQQAFGYTQEDLRVLIAPMAMNGEEPVGSMGTDTSLAVLSDRPRLLFDYFKQLFAQVTNPPLDAIREELVTSMGSTIGPERNLLKPEPESCRQIEIKYPIIHNEHVAKLRHLPPDSPFRSTTLSMLFDPEKGGAGARAGDDGPVPPRERGGGRRLRHPDPVGPRRRPAPGADSEPAGDGRRAPSPRARGHAHALRAGRRVRRRARSASRVAAARLRRRRREPVRRVRDDRRHDPAGDADRHRRATRRSSTTSRRSTRASSR